MPLLSAHGLTLSFGGPPLLDGVSFTLDAGERVCLVGRNGEGKSTLLRVVAGLEPTDQGELAFSGGAKVAYVPQEIPRDTPGTARQHVEHLLGAQALEKEAAQRIGQYFALLGVPEDEPMAALSGGQKRRVLLTAAFASAPEILMLDEPTNHLDLETIRWMEAACRQFEGALFFVTHDRAFLQAVATRIFELDRGQLSDWPCGYERFLTLREERLAAEEKLFALEDKKLRQEEIWIRKGIQARRTRNEGRVRALKALRAARQQRRERRGNVQLTTDLAGTSGQKVLEVNGLTFAWPGQPPVVQDFSTLICRGDKVGLIGPNGCGKTTLLKLLLGQLTPQRGQVQQGTRLEVVYFDQHRMVLDEEKSLFETIGEGSDRVNVGGSSKHVISYLEDFLFPPSRSQTPVKVLSGGERNRLMLAKLFTRPANVLVMDEPTNDLDLETLELLEALLVQYEGTLLLVSHDRAFLNDVVTSTMVFEGEGVVREYPGGYDDWLSQRREPEKAKIRTAPEVRAEAPATAKIKRLTNWEERELAGLPAEIEAGESRLAALTARLQEPAFYRETEAEQRRVHEELAALGAALEKRYARWEDLESRMG